MAQAAVATRKEQARSRETRTRLLDATIECLAEGGYAALTTEEVARRAGVSRGAQLHHYRTRHALVRAAIEHLDRRRLAEFRERLEGLGEGADPLTSAIEALFAVALGPLAYAELGLLAGARADSALRELLAPYVERRRTFTLDMLRPLLGRAVDHPDFVALLSTLFDALRGIATIRVLGDRSDLEARQRALLARFVRDVLRDVAPAAAAQ